MIIYIYDIVDFISCIVQSYNNNNYIIIIYIPLMSKTNHTIIYTIYIRAEQILYMYCLHYVNNYVHLYIIMIL